MESSFANRTRRQFLTRAGAAAAGSVLFALFPPGALAEDFWCRPRTLHLRRTQTGEEARETFWVDGKIIPDAYEKLCYLLRDVRAGEATRMSPQLLNIMTGIQGWFRAFGQDRVIMVNSGYRTKATNDSTENAARNSRHLVGEAGDIWLPDVPADYLAKLGQYFQGGGVGWYPDNGFVHVDSGPVRTWRG